MTVFLAVLWAKVCFEITAFENNPHSGRETRSPSHVVNISPPPNHGIQSQAMERSTFSSGPQNCRAFMQRLAVTSRDRKFSLCGILLFLRNVETPV